MKQAAIYYSIVRGSVKLLQSYFQFQKVNIFTKSCFTEANLELRAEISFKTFAYTSHISFCFV